MDLFDKALKFFGLLRPVEMLLCLRFIVSANISKCVEHFLNNHDVMFLISGITGTARHIKHNYLFIFNCLTY